MKLVTIGGKPIRVSGKFQMVPTWRLEIETTGASQAYSFNIASGSNIDLKVDWGDGTVETITTTGIKSHTYADAGTYYMHIRGSGTGLSIRQDSTSDYANAQKVKSTSAIRGIQGIVNFRDTFRNTAITSIPADLFRYNTLVSTSGFSFTFFGCSGLTGSIPDDLFRYNTLVSTSGFDSTFRDCSGLTGSIPADLFRYNTLVSTLGFYCTFRNCSGLTGSIPDDLFRYNTLVSTYGFYYTFYGCSGLTGSIPADLFRYNTLVSTGGFFATFRNCFGLTGSIPADLFRYNTLVSTLGFSATFRSCSGLEVAPDGLFKYNTAADSWQGCFQNCTKLQLSQYMFYDAGGETTRFLNQSPNFTSFVSRSSFSGTQGTAPALWDCSYGTGTPTSTSAFAGAGNSTTSLTNYNDIPAGWK